MKNITKKEIERIESAKEAIELVKSKGHKEVSLILCDYFYGPSISSLCKKSVDDPELEHLLNQGFEIVFKKDDLDSFTLKKERHDTMIENCLSSYKGEPEPVFDEDNRAIIQKFIVDKIRPEKPYYILYSVIDGWMNLVHEDWRVIRGAINWITENKEYLFESEIARKTYPNSKHQ